MLRPGDSAGLLVTLEHERLRDVFLGGDVPGGSGEVLEEAPVVTDQEQAAGAIGQGGLSL